MIVVYDVTNGDTFTNIKRWLYEIEQNCDSVSKILGMFVIDTVILILLNRKLALKIKIITTKIIVT